MNSTISIISPCLGIPFLCEMFSLRHIVEVIHTYIYVVVHPNIKYHSHIIKHTGNIVIFQIQLKNDMLLNDNG